MTAQLIIGAATFFALLLLAVRYADRAAQHEAWRRIAAARRELGEERRRSRR